MNSAQEIEGGYVLIATMELCRVWSMYRAKQIRLIDLRVWFACKEMAARRGTGKKATHVRYRLEELHRLIGGVGGEHLRSALRRLATAKLLRWSENEIRFEKMPGEFKDQEPTMLMAAKIVTARRLVPVPRRQLRLIAGGARRAVIATLLAHLIRCLFTKRGEFSSRGFCKASWIADVFGIGVRNIKDARKHLAVIGLLDPIQQPQWRMNRLGKCHAVNLAWSRTDGERRPRRTRLTPLPAVSTTSSAPPESNKELLTDLKNQKPAVGGQSGVFEKRKREIGKPVLSNIVPQDLQSVGRLLELFGQAVRAGFVPPSQNARLQFLAAAEHARAIGSRNPCGLFSAILRRRLWQVITQADEDAAIWKLKSFQERERKEAGAQSQASTVRGPGLVRDSLGSILAALSEGSKRYARLSCS
jgi:hypothetical protein